jgi:hypothetical protein
MGLKWLISARPLIAVLTPPPIKRQRVSLNRRFAFTAASLTSTDWSKAPSGAFLNHRWTNIYLSYSTINWAKVSAPPGWNRRPISLVCSCRQPTVQWIRTKRLAWWQTLGPLRPGVKPLFLWGTSTMQRKVDWIDVQRCRARRTAHGWVESGAGARKVRLLLGLAQVEFRPSWAPPISMPILVLSSKTPDSGSNVLIDPWGSPSTDQGQKAFQSINKPQAFIGPSHSKEHPQTYATKSIDIANPIRFCRHVATTQ